VIATRLDGSGVPVSVAGGKGSALDRLIGVDAPVPATGVVTTEAYRAFVSASDLGERLAALAADGTPSPDRFDDHAADVDRAFLEAPMPTDVEQAIIDLAAEIRGDGARLAVRSSATAEDQDTASFAGQYRSFLELVSDDEVLRAVRLVWSSLWHAAPMAYREHRGISHDAAMAVVVMRLIEPKTAGVLFTIDPGGEPDHLRIEFVHGLAEGLVSGTETPEAVVMERTAAPPLSDAPLAELVPLALSIEQSFGLLRTSNGPTTARRSTWSRPVPSPPRQTAPQTTTASTPPPANSTHTPRPGSARCCQASSLPCCGRSTVP